MTGTEAATLRNRLASVRPDGASVQIIVPVYNEEDILESQLVPVLEALPEGFSLRAIENGSSDRTVPVLQGLEERYPALSHISLPSPNYGLAMREGLINATGEILMIDDLDVLDSGFWEDWNSSQVAPWR